MRGLPILAGVLFVAGVLLLIGPLPVQLSTGQSFCPAGLNILGLMAPSDPLPRSDPGYEKSEACYQQILHAAPLGFGLLLAGAITVVVWAKLKPPAV